MHFGNIFSFVSFLFGATQPSGSYCGSKSVLGETVSAVVSFQDTQSLDLAISGDFVLDCRDEIYSISGSEIILRDIGLDGDCVHDALSDNQITLQHITYDGAANTIGVSVSYSRLQLNIPLSVC
jgi:hypothetical protein